MIDLSKIPKPGQFDSDPTMRSLTRHMREQEAEGLKTGRVTISSTSLPVYMAQSARKTEGERRTSRVSDLVC